jgi:predicted phosphoribosyltransferase
MNVEIIDEPNFRDKVRVFKDRFDAGELLAKKLLEYRDKDACILAIPAGGTQVAYVIAKALKLPMDLFITRKIHIPWNKEAGFGAVTWDGTTILNEPLLALLGLTKETIRRCIQEEKKAIEKRQRIFRGNKPFPSLKDKIVILVDDGLASGFSMHATLISVKRKSPREVVVAVPTASPDAIGRIESCADKIICLNIRAGPVFAVADAYQNWYDLEDRDVTDILKKLRKLRLT